MLNISSGKAVKKWISPLERFFSLEASTGVVLLCCALLALLWANSPWSEVYYKILHYPVGIHLGPFSLSFSLHHWVNDALMVIFFFVVGLEIKRELSVGELSTPKKAALPIFAALGGMFIPALFYLVFNPQGITQVGWGIPMATDIAFAIGVLSLVSKRVPFSLKVFLLALAIVDDLGAILVIALFYSQEISGRFLAFAGGLIFIIFCAKKMGIKSFLFYIFCGFGLWFFVLQSGVHATVAGVILGLMCPAGRIKNKDQKWEGIRDFSSSRIPSYKTAKKLTNMVQSLHTPAHRLIEELHFYVAWIIMPVFAFFNAGVEFKSGFSFMEFSSHPVSLGILFGLFLGKPIGVVLFSFFAVRLKLACWPKDFNWRKLTGVGFLAGIGFTMALFISHLSFPKYPELAVYSKLSILLASLLAMLTGLIFIFFSGDSLESGDKSHSLQDE
ncbi:MAG: Na+/H+ antiporter NhaA [Oligoflexia bacterium]|nr:Na+/H+ antiporter NhaA [Oligoflexia bacterium]